MIEALASSISLLERVKHGDEGFPVGWYPKLNKTWKNYFFVSHWHTEIEIIVVEKGSMEVIIGGISCILKPGTLVIIPPNTLHTAYKIASTDCSFSCLVFSPHFIESSNDDEIQLKVLTPFFQDNFSEDYFISMNELELDKIWKKIVRSLNKQEFINYLLIKGLLIQIIAEILISKSSLINMPKNDSIREQREKNILNFLEENYMKKLTLKDLSDALNLSKEQFSRFFRDSFRQSPMQYLMQFRIQKASYLLIEKDWTINTIAEVTGFDSGNYFARVFKQHLELTPTEFRKMT